MPLFTPKEREFARTVASLAYCNPFLTERIEFERQALGGEFVAEEDVWSARPDLVEQRSNVVRIQERAERLVQALRERLQSGARALKGELDLYRDLVTYALYYRHHDALAALISSSAASSSDRPVTVSFYREFVRDFETLYCRGAGAGLGPEDAAHLFACLYQVRRAFHYIFRFIVGGSMPAARLRAAVWQSVFTHDMRRYRRSLYRRMNDFSVLVTGPSGTGKELVARAVALSRYLPFDPETRRFAAVPEQTFFALNLSALSPTLIESELFGHRRGAFTGASGDHTGWLEASGPFGTVFLDEIGDTDVSIQIKLLRVLETRTFSRLGEVSPRRFEGKLIAATNRDLFEEMQQGRFREDLYYRLCSDQIVTPSLREQVQDSPRELCRFVRFLSRRLVGEEEADGLARQVEKWLSESLDADYPWPGNVRELEQCVRNILIRREYRPGCTRQAPGGDLASAIREGALSADELLNRYCTIVYWRTGSYLEAGRRLDMDRRTVKSRIDAEYLSRLQEDGAVR